MAIEVGTIYTRPATAAAAHKASHETGGADEIAVTALLGLLAADQHVLDAEVIAVAIALAQKAAASGVASLDAGSVVVQQPPIHTVAKHSDMAFVDKAADETVNNSIVFQNDNHLLHAVAANEVWKYLFYLRSDGDAAADIKFQVVVPAGGLLEIISHGLIGNSVAAGTLNPIDASVSIPFATAPGAVRICMFWCLYIGGGNAGNVQLQWAQQAAIVGDIFVRENSYLIAHQLA